MIFTKNKPTATELKEFNFRKTLFLRAKIAECQQKSLGEQDEVTYNRLTASLEALYSQNS